MSIVFKKAFVLSSIFVLLSSMPLFVETQHTASAQGSGNGKIAFQSYRDGNSEIYVMDADGSNPTNLTNHAAADYVPNWSPDGTQIAFAREIDGNSEIYVMEADGSNQTRLTNHVTADFDPDWSPDGTQIAFTSSRDWNGEIYVMDTDGSNPTNLTNHAAADEHPDWSPDGTQIAFQSYRDNNSEIYVMEADGSNPTRLTNHAAEDSQPVWSPDGTQIAFMSDRDGNSYEIYVIEADGSNPTRLTNNTVSDVYPAWSPDGTQITFASERDGNWEIYVMDADGSNPIRLTNNATDDLHPVWYGTPYTGGCHASAPATAYQGDSFTLTLGCEDISGSVFGFQAGHEITAGAGLVTAQAASYTAGTVFQGQPVLEGPNTLSLYALSLQAGGTEATGDFTLGSVDYSADFPGDATFDLINLIMGNINGEAIANAQASPSVTTVTIIDLILSLSGTVDPEGFVSAENLELDLEGNPAYDDLQKTLNPDGTIDFVFTNIKGQPAWLQADGPSHLTCEETLFFPPDAGNEVLPNVQILRAGDVNSDDTVDITDAVAIGLGYGQPPTGELDINGDGAVNILDLIHVGRNYGTTGPTDCTP